MSIIKKGTKLIIGDEECTYGVYIALKDIDLEAEIYDFDDEVYYSLSVLLDIEGSVYVIDVLRREGYIKPDEQFPYLNLCDDEVVLENHPNY